MYKTIKSLDDAYAVNETGSVLSMRTGKIINQRQNDGSSAAIVMITLNGVPSSRTVRQLVLEAHGKDLDDKIPRVDRRGLSCMIEVSKGDKVQCFKSIRAAARYLAPLVYLSIVRVEHIIGSGRPEICGYKIKKIEFSC